jgi:RND family efflux transporter MFP subunit
MPDSPSDLSAQLNSLRIDKNAVPPVRSKWLMPMLGAGALLLVAVLWLAVSSSRPPLVETGFVIRQAGAGGATALLTGGGYVVTKDQVIVSAEVAGRVTALNFDKGDIVKKGQWLAKLDDRDYRVAALHAAADRQKAAAELLLADSQVKRARDLLAKKFGSQEALDSAERTRAVTAAALAQANAGEAEAQLNLERTVVKAPFDGTVLERLIQVGETARPGFGGGDNKVGVAKLADLKDLEVEVDITERDLAKIKEGQRCLVVVDAYPDRKYEAFVRLRSPEANRQKSIVQAKVKIEKPDEFLRPEMNAQVTFFEGKPDAAAPTLILVPKSAVADGAVFVVKEGAVIRTTFEAGGEQGSNLIVKRGLNGGEEVVLDPASHKLQDGKKIRMKNPAEN